MRTGALEAAEIIEKRTVPELGAIRKPTAGEAFRELERSGYFEKMPKTNGFIDRFISEDRDR